MLNGRSASPGASASTSASSLVLAISATSDLPAAPVLPVDPARRSRRPPGSTAPGSSRRSGGSCCRSPAPALAAVAILQFQGTWNGFFWPVVLLQDRDHWTLPLGLFSFVTSGGFSTNWPPLMAVGRDGDRPDPGAVHLLPALLRRGHRGRRRQGLSPAPPSAAGPGSARSSARRSATSTSTRWRLVPLNLIWGARPDRRCGSCALVRAAASFVLVAAARLPDGRDLPGRGASSTGANRPRSGTGSRSGGPDRRSILLLGIAITALLGDVPREHRGRADEWQLPRLGDRHPRGMGRARHVARWPGRRGRILLDPARAEGPVRERLRTAGLLVLAFPVRLAALGGLLAIVVLVSAVAVVALADRSPWRSRRSSRRGSRCPPRTAWTPAGRCRRLRRPDGGRRAGPSRVGAGRRPATRVAHDSG